MPTINFTLQPAEEATEVLPVGVILSSDYKVALLGQDYSPFTDQYGSGPGFTFDNVPVGDYRLQVFTLKEDGAALTLPFIDIPVRCELRHVVPSKYEVSIVADAPPAP